MLTLERWTDIAERSDITITVPPSDEPQKILVRLVEIKHRPTYKFGSSARLGFEADRSIAIVRADATKTYPAA